VRPCTFAPTRPKNHVKVVIRGLTRPRTKSCWSRWIATLRKRIGPGIYGVDGETFPKVVGQALRAGPEHAGLAESCTGGEAGQDDHGRTRASDFFLGSVVAYSNRRQGQCPGCGKPPPSPVGRSASPVPRRWPKARGA